jgi:hypothetical protein
MELCCNSLKIMKWGTFFTILMNGDTNELQNDMTHGPGVIAVHGYKELRSIF